MTETLPQALRGPALEALWAEASSLLRAARDVIVGREGGLEPPAWVNARGWTRFVESLADDEVARAERDGLTSCPDLLARAPADLAALARAAGRVEAALAWRGAPGDPTAPAVDPRGASPRKRAQVAAFAAAVGSLAERCARVVDVGSGHGHLTRHLARLGGRPVLGLERDPERVAVATRRAEQADVPADFAAHDVLAGGLPLRAGDLAVGLHACGALGDALVRAAADTSAAVALVSCCLQRTPAPDRVPLSIDDAALVWPREVLGLSNRTLGEAGVAGPLDVRVAARRHRLALHLLLRRRGLGSLPPGAEMRGINRRQAYKQLATLAAAAWARHFPGTPPPSPAELAAAEAEAETLDRAHRRQRVVRVLFARPLEVFGVLDRALVLTTAGHTVAVGALFPPQVSPRNLLLLAEPIAPHRRVI